MTFLNPTLRLNHLRVTKDGRPVFDAAFHAGVNIVRGNNSAGKTTVLDFIAYTLGAECIPFKAEALLCDWSVAEVLLNGSPVTLRREVSETAMMPLYIFWGPIDAAMEAGALAWEVYPFRRSSKLSFTQALLLALEMPEAQGDGASNLTMHQFLRVMYADQPSLHSPIFRSDSFDSALTRETVGVYLSGIYDDKLYSAQLEKRSLEKAISQHEAELRSIFAVLAKSAQNANFEFLGAQIIDAERERAAMLQELTRLKTERTVVKAERAASIDAQLRLELDSAKAALFNAQDRLSHKEIEAEDSLKFIQEIEGRLSKLDESQITRNYFGSVIFSLCPCCLSEVKPPDVDSKICSLCKSELMASAADSQVLRMRNELRIQLEESKAIANARDIEISALRADIPGLKQALIVLERRYADSAHVWSSDLESAVETISRKIGVIDQEIKGYCELKRLAEVIGELQAKRDELVFRASEVESIIESLIHVQEERKKSVFLEVSTTLARLLREDLPRQPEFERATNVQFSFTDNVVSVEGATKFSESSTVVLRHLFHVSLLSAATRIPDMRLPRFMMLDGIEDGGMELLRSHRLQETIVNECSNFTCDFQIIFATSQIAPSLDIDAFVVARSFSKERRSLDILPSATASTI